MVLKCDEVCHDGDPKLRMIVVAGARRALREILIRPLTGSRPKYLTVIS